MRVSFFHWNLTILYGTTKHKYFKELDSVQECFLERSGRVSIEKYSFWNVINSFISVSMHENWKFTVPTSTAHNITPIKCLRHKNFKDLMYRNPKMKKIKFENAHFCKTDYIFPSEHTVPDSTLFQKTYSSSFREQNGQVEG